ncbi:unnamed protein product, partial [Ectocarpus sp. 13 AM-2016]
MVQASVPRFLRLLLCRSLLHLRVAEHPRMVADSINCHEDDDARDAPSRFVQQNNTPGRYLGRAWRKRRTSVPLRSKPPIMTLGTSGRVLFSVQQAASTMLKVDHNNTCKGRRTNTQQKRQQQQQQQQQQKQRPTSTTSGSNNNHHHQINNNSNNNENSNSSTALLQGGARAHQALRAQDLVGQRQRAEKILLLLHELLGLLYRHVLPRILRSLHHSNT